MSKVVSVEDSVSTPCEKCDDHNVYVGLSIDTETGEIVGTPDLISLCKGDEWPGEAS